MGEKINCGLCYANTEEPSLYEELKALDIDDVVKARLISKLDILLSNKGDLESDMVNRDHEISILKDAIINLVELMVKI